MIYIMREDAYGYIIDRCVIALYSFRGFPFEGLNERKDRAMSEKDGLFGNLKAIFDKKHGDESDVLQFGVVVRYFDAPDRKYGFIDPDIPRPDGRNIFFHRGNGCDVQECILGAIELIGHTRPGREPVESDRVAFYVGEHPKGPRAVHWTFAALYKDRERVIASRPHPEQPMCRVVDYGATDPVVLWEGPMASLDGHLDAVRQDLVGKNARIEDLLAHGWVKRFEYDLADDDGSVGEVMTEEELLRGLEGLAQFGDEKPKG